MTKATEHVVVIGGGVIGAMCAWYLCKSGHKVTIVDRDKFGSACSHGNCGYVCTSHVLPLTQPGVIRQSLPTLWKADSPLSIKLRWAPDLWRWLWKFARRCNFDCMMDAALGRHLLLNSSMGMYEKLIKNERIECEWTENGLLFVFLTQQHFEHFGETNELVKEKFGVEAHSIVGQQLEKFEPALKPGIAGAWHYRGDRHVRPDMLMSSLRQKLADQGCEFVEGFSVEKFIGADGHCDCVEGSGQQQIQGDSFVLAAGALSPFLNQHLGCNLPIQPGKGYSITMPHPRIVPKTPIVFEEHSVGITPMQSKYRIGSTMEFAGYDTTLNRGRLDALKHAAEVYLHEPHATPVEEEWYGWRPMTWDGKPIIDYSPAMNNVLIAAGHNMLGVSMATATGKLIQEMIDDEQPHLPLEHYCLSRLN